MSKDSESAENEKRYQEILSRLPVPCYMLNAEAYVTFYNDAAVKLWGRAPELNKELWCGSPGMSEIDGTPMPLEKCPAARAFKEKRSIRGMEGYVIRPDGSKRCVIPHPDPLFDAQGNFTGLVNIIFDVSEERMATEAARKARDEALAASRAKDDFLAALSHELRTPLTPMLMSVMALEQDATLPYEARQSLGMIGRNVQLEASLIDDLLDLTRIARGKLELHSKEMDFHTVLKRALEICRSDYSSKKQRIVLNLNATQHHSIGDPIRLQQVFWNLIRNASKFTQSDGTIEVRSSNPEDGRILLEVQDNGRGFEPNSGPNLFEAFEQGGREITRQFGGLGLGLAISRSIVETHGGKISAQSKGIGQGATFMVELPLVALKSFREKSISASPTLSPIKTFKHILLVEDHKDTRTSLEFLLRKNEYEVKSAATAAEAVELAKAHKFVNGGRKVRRGSLG